MIPHDVIVDVYDGIGTLPHFNDAAEAPNTVLDFRNRIKAADAVLICTPEYAFGVPGSLKNALDWVVGSGELMNKPVSLITASSQGERGHAALLLILNALSAMVIEEGTLLIPFVRSKLDANAKVSDLTVMHDLQKVLDATIHTRK